jgi:hypothetical protein
VSTRIDPLSAQPLEGPDRVHYAEGVLLDARDFTDEQSYHRGRLARALQYLAGTGTVVGLDVTWRADEQEVVVSPGVAIDPLGRLVELPRAACIRLRRWFAAQRPDDLREGWLTDAPRYPSPVVIADVFLRFVVCERGKTPAFASGPYDALDAVAPARLRDGYELALVVRTEAGDRRRGGDPVPEPDARAVIDHLFDPTADLDERLRRAEDAILTGWRGGSDLWTDGKPPRLVEHMGPRLNPLPAGERDPTEVGRDPTAVMLARVAIPVAPPTGSQDPPSDLEQPPAIEARNRRFVYAPGLITAPAR